MQDIAPIIATTSAIKFVPASLKIDKIIKRNSVHYDSLLQEQSEYLANYDNCRVGGLSDDMLNFKTSGKTICQNILDSLHVIDIHFMMFTDDKEIWTVDSTKDDYIKQLRILKQY
eukprot:12581461-Ditylum_brightwellii.AAC.1